MPAELRETVELAALELALGRVLVDMTLASRCSSVFAAALSRLGSEWEGVDAVLTIDDIAASEEVRCCPRNIVASCRKEPGMPHL
jgi:hypothetical protein